MQYSSIQGLNYIFCSHQVWQNFSQMNRFHTFIVNLSNYVKYRWNNQPKIAHQFIILLKIYDLSSCNKIQRNQYFSRRNLAKYFGVLLLFWCWPLDYTGVQMSISHGQTSLFEQQSIQLNCLFRRFLLILINSCT